MQWHFFTLLLGVLRAATRYTRQVLLNMDPKARTKPIDRSHGRICEKTPCVTICLKQNIQEYEGRINNVTETLLEQAYVNASLLIMATLSKWVF